MYGEVVHLYPNNYEFPVVLLCVSPMLYVLYVKVEALKPYTVDSEPFELPSYYQAPPLSYKNEAP